MSTTTLRGWGFSAIRWAPTRCPNCRCQGSEGSARKAPGEGATSLNSPGVCWQVPRRLLFRMEACMGAMLSGPNRGSGLQVLLRCCCQSDLEMSPSDVMSLSSRVSFFGLKPSEALVPGGQFCGALSLCPPGLLCPHVPHGPKDHRPGQLHTHHPLPTQGKPVQQASSSPWVSQNAETKR